MSTATNVRPYAGEALCVRPRVAYIVSRFPKLSETFVLYEMVTMERLGADVQIYSLLRHQESVVHPEAKALLPRVHFSPILSVEVLRAHAHYLRRRPGKYFKVLIEILVGTSGSLNFFAGALAFFPKAVRFAYEIEHHGIGHVHAQFATHPALAALIAYRLTGTLFSFSAQGTDVHVDRTMLRTKVEAAEYALTVSSFNKDLMVRECGEHVRNKIHVVYGGVDTDQLLPRVRHVNDGPFRMLCVARFEEVKGHAYLVSACKLLRSRGMRFECHLIGDGPLRAKVKKQVAQLGLSDVVLLHGALPYKEVAAQFARADVVVLATAPTRKGQCEGIPNVLKEAMACRIPVVGSNVSGIPELVHDGLAGMLVPPRDATALADALQTLAADPDLRQRMGEYGRQFVLQNFSLKRSTRRRAQLFFPGWQSLEMQEDNCSGEGPTFRQGPR